MVSSSIGSEIVPKYVVCYKWVADEADIRILDDLSVDLSRAKYKISDFDRSAIEAAMLVADTTGAEVCTLAFGGTEVSASLKSALSRGPVEGYWIASEAAEQADGRVTALALASGIKAIGSISAVFCAEGASDTYARQVPGRIAAQLDWPLISSVLSFAIEGDVLTAVRKLDDCLQTVQATLPVVISVLPEGYEPRTPGLKAVMEGGRKPSTELSCSELGLDLEPRRHDVNTRGFIMSRRNIILKDLEAQEAATQLAAALRKDGVL
jgi:electron transfer flavoprotein beta subunit